MDDSFGDIHNTLDLHLNDLHKESLNCVPMFMSLKEDSLCSIDKIPGLDKCLCSRNKAGFILPKGSLDSEFIFLVEHMSKESEKILLEYCQALGISNDQAYFTNTVFCKAYGNNHVEVDDLYKCIRFKKEEFRQLKHLKYIFPIGNYAFQIVTSIFSSIMPYVGSYFDIKLFGRDIKIIPLYHPGYILRKPSEGERIFRMLRQLSGLE